MSVGVAHAEPDQDERAELEAELSALNEDYNVAQEDHEAAEERLESIEEQLDEVEEVLESRKHQIRGLAVASYAGASYDTVSFLFDDPDEALSGAADIGYLAEGNKETLTAYLDEHERLEALQQEAAETEEEAAEALDKAEEAMERGEEALEELEDAPGEGSGQGSQASGDDTAADASPASSGGSGDSSGSTPGVSGDVQKVLDYARAQIGKPYVWGGTGPDGFDCSGLTLRAWQQAGVELPRVSQDQWNAGTRIDRSDIKPGDLLFFYDSSAPTHVGIYSGNGNMIHGSNPSRPLEEVDLASYWDSVFVGAVRPS
jgi:peptidoglycan DL-endopeptidase CwlO